jgi:hypothetical protein
MGTTLVETVSATVIREHEGGQIDLDRGDHEGPWGRREGPPMVTVACWRCR